MGLLSNDLFEGIRCRAEQLKELERRSKFQRPQKIEFYFARVVTSSVSDLTASDIGGSRSHAGTQVYSKRTSNTPVGSEVTVIHSKINISNLVNIL
jgi:hypothetical protein